MSGMSRRHWRGPLALDRVEIREQVVDLGRVELELGHGGMARRDALREGFRQILDGVAGMQCAERRRLGNGAVAETADGVALGAVRLREDLSALHPARL